jgi:threonine dehydrogenase-like Zn-dependent dehydrogenase
MGEIVEVGSAIEDLKKGDRVVVPFTISCGECLFCKKACIVATYRTLFGAGSLSWCLWI